MSGDARTERQVDPLDAELRESDSGNALRFVREYRGRVRYCHPWKCWIVWDGHRWIRAVNGEAIELAKKTVSGIFTEASYAETEDERRRLGKWAVKSQSRAALHAMLDLAQSVAGIPIQPAQLDADPWLLGALNGTVELRTGTLRPARPEDFITLTTAAPFEPGARHPVFDAYLERVLPDPDVRGCVQRVAGYALTGSTREEKIFFFQGPTASGKSTFLLALQRTLGDYAAKAAVQTFLERNDDAGTARGDLARLAAVRLVVSSEAPKNRRLAEQLIKETTGGDPITCRALFKDEITYLPQFTVIIGTNFRPRASDDDDALWRRVVEISFAESLPAAERDPAVKAVLCDPAQAGAAILAWAVEGCLAWQRDGLRIPAAVTQATADYRQAMDPLRGFWECCVLEEEASVAAGDLRGRYEGWAKEQGVRYPLNGNAFAERLFTRGCRPHRGAAGRREWRGIRLRGPMDPDPVTAVTPGDVTSLFPRSVASTTGHRDNGVTAATSVTVQREPGDEPEPEWVRE